MPGTSPAMTAVSQAPDCAGFISGQTLRYFCLVMLGTQVRLPGRVLVPGAHVFYRFGSEDADAGASPAMTIR